MANLKGEAFTHDDFTPAQLANLKGEAFTYDDFTVAQLANLKGEAFTYDDFTPAQLANLKGQDGTSFSNKGEWVSGTEYNSGDYVFYPSDGVSTTNVMWIIKTETVYTSTVPPYQDTDKWVKFEAPKGEKGDAFAYSDFTTAQLDELKGPKGDTGIGLKNKGEWVVNQIYEPGDYVFDQSDATSTNNVMWISKLETNFTSTLPPYQDTDKWVKFEAPRGYTGAKGDKGEAFTYSDFTPAQLENLKGEKRRSRRKRIKRR